MIVMIRFLRILLFFLIGMIIGKLLAIIQSFFNENRKSKIVQKILFNNMSIQNNLFAIYKMTGDISKSIPELNKEWPFFDELEMEDCNMMDTIIHAVLEELHEHYNDVIGSLVVENFELEKYKLTELSKKNKEVEKISNCITNEYQMISSMYKQLLIMQYVTDTKEDMKEYLSTINSLMKIRFKAFSTSIKAYNKIHTDTES